MNSILEKMLAVAFFIALAVAFFFALKTGIERSEKAECEKWLGWSAEYPLYYSTDWQLEQCEHYGIKLPR